MPVNLSNVTNAGIAMPSYQSKNTVQTADNSLGKDAFLKLLAAQARSQDPLSPTDNTQQIAQLAQFSSLEQMQNVATEIKSLNVSQASNTAINLVGRDVSYIGADGTRTSATVEKVSIVSGAPVLTIGGVENIALGSVVEVR